MDYYSLVMGAYIAGIVLMLNGAVQLAVRNRKGLWKEGGANFVTGVIVAGGGIGGMVWLIMRAVAS